MWGFEEIWVLGTRGGRETRGLWVRGTRGEGDLGCGERVFGSNLLDTWHIDIMTWGLGERGLGERETRGLGEGVFGSVLT